MKEEVVEEMSESQDPESQSSLEEEVKAGEWTRLNEFGAFQRRSRQGKIIATYQAISNRLNQLVSLYYELVRNNPQKSVRLLREIKKLRSLQEYLLKCLIWEEEGDFESHPVPEELMNIL